MDQSQRRLKTSDLLNEIKAAGHVSKVYFSPDEESQMVYPCITYSRDPTYTVAADNQKYLVRDRYTVTLIDRMPLNPAFDVLLNLPHCSHQTSFVADGLHHDVFDLYH